MRDDRAYFTLRVTEEGAPPRTHRLDEGVASVGRSSRDNAVQLLDARVSSHHAEVIVDGSIVRVRDLGSTNGTFVRRLEGGELSAPRRVDPQMPLTLSPGDEVRVGDPEGVTMRLELEPVFLERIAGPLPLSSPSDPPRLQFVERLLARMDISGIVEALVALVLESFPEPEHVLIWGQNETPLIQARRVPGGPGRAGAGSTQSFERARSPLPFSRTVLAHVRATREVVVFGTPLSKELDVASLRASRIVAGFCAPLTNAKDEVVGIVQADGRTVGFVPDRTQLEEVARIARAAGAVIEQAMAAESVRSSAQALERETETLRRELGERRRLQGIVGRHPLIAQQLELAVRVSALSAPVLVLGETGTGKELVARAIHHASPRKDAPFLVVNCAELPASLAESELFGFERGTFTGAERDRPGLFERAHGGTLFLDEIGEASLNLQAMLLRVIERHEVRRIGARDVRPVDVRVIAATNRDLEAEIGKGAFRRDLYFRLAVTPIKLPPLRDRREDIPELVEHILGGLRTRLARPRLRVSPGALEALVLDPWRGNVRELENRLLRAAILAPHDEIEPEHVSTGSEPRAQALEQALWIQPLREARDEFTRAHVRRALEVCRGNRKAAAQLLKLDPSNLLRTMRRLGMIQDEEPVESDPSLEF
ncbi:MAG TPA: sigma 54-interacting transcriptional regulator [Planctomycetota bacterium]|nr:sigma 54-interacting transcriptional regulator [Planctomycetota bacterium]